MKYRIRTWLAAAAVIGGALLILNASIAHSATPPPSRQAETKQVRVGCGYHVLATWVFVDVDTKQPLGMVNEESIYELGLLPAPCPEGMGQ